MINAGQGQQLTLEADFYAYDGGPGIELVGLALTVVDPNNITEINATTTTGVTNPATGIYQYAWTVPLTAPIGTHVATWSGTYNGTPVTAVETILVAATGVGLTWCTTADVLAITGITVSVDVLAQAGAMIDMACARPYATFITGVPTGQVSKISATDQYWLKLACAYQAAWLPSQVDVMQRIDAQAVQAGRRMIQLNPGAILLSPLAQAALRRVGFLKSRSLHVPGPMDLDRPWLGAGVGDDEDSGPGWQDLGPVG